jgi:hypothetical protein
MLLSYHLDHIRPERTEIGYSWASFLGVLAKKTVKMFLEIKARLEGL